LRISKLNRVVHRWGSVAIAVPLVVVIATGILLLLKKESGWIQPPTARGSVGPPALPFARILDIARTVPEAEIQSWEDIDRLDVRPGRGVVKVRAENRWEIQVDTKTGEILQVAFRRSDLIESIHDGSFFLGRVRLWVFLPSAVLLFGLWVTGLYLFVLPYWTKWSRKRKRDRSRPTVSGAAVRRKSETLEESQAVR
jgi:uncharacterized iron-regulated membrane protein